MSRSSAIDLSEAACFESRDQDRSLLQLCVAGTVDQLDTSLFILAFRQNNVKHSTSSYCPFINQ